MYKVLVSAYSCSPNRGSEPGMGWNWCVNLSKYCELHIINEGEWSEEIEKEKSKLAHGHNMIFYYNPLPEKAREMSRNQGDWRFYYYYAKWHKSTYLLALEIMKNQKIDIIHQLNMIGFREPGYLWKIKNTPFVWGPVDAKVEFPLNYIRNEKFKTKLIQYLKNFITDLQLRLSIRVRQTVRRSNMIISASSESKISFKKYFNVDSFLLNETGCYIQESNYIKKNNTKFKLLWVGKFDIRKQLNLALRTIALLDNNNIELHIIGTGDNKKYEDLAKSLNIEKQCIWHGEISHDAVQNMMQSSDLFFFTSVAEGTPHVVLEALSNNLPVLCFDCCGHGDSIDSTVGIKIKLSNPDKSISEFKEKINYLYQNRIELSEMSLKCKERQLDLSWDRKATSMLEIYKKAINTID